MTNFDLNLTKLGAVGGSKRAERAYCTCGQAVLRDCLSVIPYLPRPEPFNS